MASAKVTFTLDQATVTRLQDAAARLGKPKSEVVRDAVLEYYDRIGRLSERERASMLKIFDELVPKIPSRTAAEADREISEIRRARRAGGRRTGRRIRK
ncbi:MAG: ribbon-helix-helix protein, CopG family [Bryobacteraceae bacterium]